MGEHTRQLTRVRALIGAGAIPRDLGDWLLDLLEALEPAAERLARRDALLREAGERLSGSAWARAGRLVQEIRDQRLPRRLLTREAPLPDAVRDLVAQALAIAPAPRERRQLYRLLRGY